MKRVHRFLSATLILPVALLASCHVDRPHPIAKSPDGSVSRETIPVQIVSVTSGSLIAHHSAAGTITPVTESKVAAQVSGVVLRVDHRAGASVKQGEVVVQLDDSQLKLAVESAQAALDSAKANVEKAKAQLDLAQLNLGRDERLLEENSVSQSRVDNGKAAAETAQVAYLAAQAEAKQAQASLDQAKLNLRYASVRAPFGGQLAAVAAQVGEFVRQSAPVFVLVSPGREIDFEVPPADASVLGLGKSITFTMEGRSYDARISQTPSAPINGVVPVVARLSSIHTLPYGAVGKVSYPVDLGSGSIVPISALQTTGNQDFVYIVVSGKAARRKVQVTAESSTKAVVAGLAVGAHLIANPPPGLLEGSPVTPAESRHG